MRVRPVACCRHCVATGLPAKLNLSDSMLERLRQDEIYRLEVQNSFKMGYLGVKTAVDFLQKKTVEKRIDTDVTIIKKADLDRPEMRELLFPDLEKWLKK